MLKIHRFGRSVFVTDTDLGDPRFGTCVYGEKFSTERKAREVSDGLCQEIASGLPNDKLSIAADIEERMVALRHLPPAWR